MTSRAERWGMALIYVLFVTGYPAISSVPLWLGLDSRAVTVPYRAFVVVVSLVMTVYALRRRRLYCGLFWAPLALFWGGYVLRLSADTVFMPLSTLRMPASEYWLYGIGTCFIPMLPLFAESEERTMALAFRVVYAAAMVSCCLALWAAVIALRSGVSLDGAQGLRLGTDTLNPISLGNLGVSVAVFAIWYLMVERPASALLRLLVLLSLVVGVFTALAAASKGPLLVLVAVAPILAWKGIQLGMRSKVIIFGAFVIAGGAAGAQYVENSLGFGVISRLASLASGEGDESSMLRVQLMGDAWDEFVAHPFLGNAVDETENHEYPHNVLVESLMATGLIGGALFVVLLLGSAYAAVVVLRHRLMSVWVCFLYIQAIISALVSGSLYESTTLWCSMAAVVALAATTAATRKTPVPHQPLLAGGVT